MKMSVGFRTCTAQHDDLGPGGLEHSYAAIQEQLEGSRPADPHKTKRLCDCVSVHTQQEAYRLAGAWGSKSVWAALRLWAAQLVW